MRGEVRGGGRRWKIVEGGVTEHELARDGWGRRKLRRWKAPVMCISAECIWRDCGSLADCIATSARNRDCNQPTRRLQRQKGACNCQHGACSARRAPATANTAPAAPEGRLQSANTAPAGMQSACNQPTRRVSSRVRDGISYPTEKGREHRGSSSDPQLSPASAISVASRASSTTLPQASSHLA